MKISITMNHIGKGTFGEGEVKSIVFNADKKLYNEFLKAVDENRFFTYKVKDNHERKINTKYISIIDISENDF